MYDIETEDGARISRHVFKIAKKYMNHVQKSVFEGELSEAQYCKMKMELKGELRSDKDSCVIFQNNNPKWMKKDMLTNLNESTDNFL